MAIDGKPVVYFCLPFGGAGTLVDSGASRFFWWQGANASKDYHILRDSVGFSSIPHNFNQLLCNATNLRDFPDEPGHVPGGVDYLCMQHADVIPLIDQTTDGPWGGLDILMDEIRRLDADMVSSVLPIKTDEAITTTGVMTSTGRRRFTMSEIVRFPETFCAEDIGYPGCPMVLNTGFWVMNLRRPWVNRIMDEPCDGASQSGFYCHTRIGKDAQGHRVPIFESEDWNWALDVQRLGGKVYATRKVKAVHRGHMDWNNWEAWGKYTVDPCWKPVLPGPPGVAGPMHHGSPTGPLGTGKAK